MRYLPDVIDQVLTLIPDEERELRATLEDQKDSVFYAAPEAIGYWWAQVALTMMDFNMAESIPWKKSVMDIWMDRMGK